MIINFFNKSHRNNYRQNLLISQINRIYNIHIE